MKSFLMAIVAAGMFAPMAYADDGALACKKRYEMPIAVRASNGKITYLPVNTATARCQPQNVDNPMWDRSGDSDSSTSGGGNGNGSGW